MTEDTTIEESIAWLEDIRGDSMPEDILPLEATLAFLAMLADPRVVRVPLDQLELFVKAAVGGNGSPLVAKFEKQVAAWDKERK